MSSFKYRSKVDIVYEELRTQILEGGLPPGSSINQEKLAATFGISTTPLREALRRLETEGLMKLGVHRQVVVTTLDAEEMLAVYEVREELDALAARLAAQRYDEDDRERIEAATASIADADDPLEANRTFHSAIYCASHNAALIDVLDTLWDRSDRYRRLVLVSDLDAQQTEEHRALSEAVLARRAAEAAKIVRAHVRRTRRIIEGLLESSTHSGR